MFHSSGELTRRPQRRRVGVATGAHRGDAFAVEVVIGRAEITVVGFPYMRDLVTTHRRITVVAVLRRHEAVAVWVMAFVIGLFAATSGE